jgi:hypothetical protein
MNAIDQVELYILKCASLKLAVDQHSIGVSGAASDEIASERLVTSFIGQFSADVRADAERMSEYYKLFYMLENDIRKFIDDTLADAYGVAWWEEHSPPSAKEECKSNQKREQEAGVTARSDNELDYVTFGHLGDIIRANYILFGGILSNEKALNRAMFSLNTLRGPIAHCGLLAEDEVDRLKLAVKDWFRLLEGPK